MWIKWTWGYCSDGVGDSSPVTSYLARHTGMKSSVRMNGSDVIGWVLGDLIVFGGTITAT